MPGWSDARSLPRAGGRDALLRSQPRDPGTGHLVPSARLSRFPDSGVGLGPVSIALHFQTGWDRLLVRLGAGLVVRVRV